LRADTVKTIDSSALASGIPAFPKPLGFGNVNFGKALGMADQPPAASSVLAITSELAIYPH
jgi:hypothetical protein